MATPRQSEHEDRECQEISANGGYPEIDKGSNEQYRDAWYAANLYNQAHQITKRN